MSTKVKSPDDLPKKPGIYIMKDLDDKIIYIGKSKSLRTRVKSYFKEKHDQPKTKILMSHFNSLEYIITDSEKEALILEANLIKKHKPRYNIRLKDDKRYPYVKITEENFPRLIITRNISKTGNYFGPFTDVGSVRQTVKFLKSLFKIRTCRKMDGPCLNCQINLCYGPCAGNISKKEYNELIKKIDLFFQGKYTKIIENLEKEMDESASEFNFEKAAVLRDQIASIVEVMEKQFVDFADELDQDVIAMSFDGDKAIVVVFSIRNGKINGKDDFLMSGVKNNKSYEVISAFIQQYYGINRHVPKEIILEEKIKDKEENQLIIEWLTDLREESQVKSNSLKEGNKDKLNSLEEGNKDKLNSLEEGNKDKLNSLEEGNKDKLNSLKEGNKDKLDSLKEGNPVKSNSLKEKNQVKSNNLEEENEIKVSNQKKRNEVKLTVPLEGSKLRLIRMVAKNAEIIKKQKKKMKNGMIELKKYLKLPKLPRIIEGYDVSNISGKLAVGSKVSFLDGTPNKKQYKRFKLETPGPNDYEMMRELLSRRLKPLTDCNEDDEIANKCEKPNLILIDGGKGQLAIATEVLKKYNLEHIPVIGLAKEFEEIFIPQSQTPIIIPQNNEALHLLQRVRDEAHRFAVTYHRKLRSKTIEGSELDNIVGIGKKRKIKLLKHFGDIEKIKKASVDEIANVKGLNKTIAKTVYDNFH